MIIVQALVYFIGGLLVGGGSQRIVLKSNVSHIRALFAGSVIFFCEGQHWLLSIVGCLGISIGIALQPVGLTGGIACGKSSVARKLVEENPDEFSVIDVDGIAHSILEPGIGAAYGKIVKEFGHLDIFETATESLQTPRKINRRKLGEVIFPNNQRRKRLNQITHPIITKLMIWEMIKLKCLQFYPVVVVDIPLLFEGKLQWLFGLVIVVACSSEIQLKRLMSRNKDLTEKQCQDRVASQMPIVLKCSKADCVIYNDGSVEELNEKIHDTIKQVRKRHGRFHFLQLIAIGMTLKWVGLKIISGYQ